jgi:hypothetical protein
MMIDHMLIKLKNPVTFSILHILKHYKMLITAKQGGGREYREEADLTGCIEGVIKREIAAGGPNA